MGDVDPNHRIRLFDDAGHAIGTLLRRYKALRVIAWLVGLGLIAWWAIDGGSEPYSSLDRAGWIVREHQTPVWIQGDWLSGEYRTCQMLTSTNGWFRFRTDGSLSPNSEAELRRLFCSATVHSASHTGANSAFSDFYDSLSRDDFNAASAAFDVDSSWHAVDRHFHVLSVRFNGRIDRPKDIFVSWRCQRREGSIACWALN